MKTPGPAVSRASSTAFGAEVSVLRFSQTYAGYLAVLLCIVGTFAVLSTDFSLWGMWVNDPLKSIGGFVPLVSLALIVRVWRSMGWAMDRTSAGWWGLAVLAGIIALVHVRDIAIIEFVVSPSWAVFVPPHQAVAVAYAAGAVLLFGGWRLLRAAAFPVGLMWLVNPVPNFFTLQIDLPLQHLSSMTARGFAHALGQKLTPDQLRLMFTPEFGMFIAPGCNGIRGAITMGMIALVAGYLYQFRPRAIALMVACAVLLAYVFNLVRLCSLVLYYIVALHLPWLQSRAEMGDYIIGGLLFFVATALLFTVVQHWSPNGDLWPPRLRQAPVEVARSPVPRSFWPRWGALLAVVLLGSVSYARGLMRSAPGRSYDAQTLGVFPAQVGGFALKKTWNETLLNGPLIFYWADYAAADGTEISVGVSPVLGAHDTLICHAARGEDWLWHGNLAMATAGGATEFSGSFFNDGATQYVEATTLCTGEACGQVSTERRHFGFIYSRPDTNALLSQSPTRPIPVLLRSATTDTAKAPDLARRELTEAMRGFLSQARLAEFTRPYREP